jgi:hypothetical protein
MSLLSPVALLVGIMAFLETVSDSSLSASTKVFYFWHGEDVNHLH